MSRRTPHPGFTLVETMISTVLAGGLLVAALSTVGAARLGQYQLSNTCRGMALAQSLWAEMAPLAYVDPNGTGSLGLETGESLSTRAELNDVDDYDGLDLDPVTDCNGTTLEAFADWNVTVSVAYADLSDPSTDASSDTGLKRVTIEALYQDKTWATLVVLKSEAEL